MKKLLCLLFAAFLLCVSASALELPSGLDDIVPRELIDSAEAGDDLLLRGGQYLFSHFRAALQDAVANSLRGAMALMLLSLLCGLIEGTAESAGETVRKVSAALEGAGVSCWYVPRDCDEQYAGSIVAGIRNCRVFQLILNEKSNLSAHVLNEINCALTGFGTTRTSRSCPSASTTAPSATMCITIWAGLYLERDFGPDNPQVRQIRTKRQAAEYA